MRVTNELHPERHRARIAVSEIAGAVLPRPNLLFEVEVQADAGHDASVFEMGCKNGIRRCAGCARDNGAICGE
jgi:hypothetical protein